MKALPSASVLTKLSALQHLNLSHNELTSLPAALATLPSIQTLDVSHNCLVELPLNLATHQSLQLLAAHNPLRLELPLDTARRLEAEDTLFVDPAFPANEHSLFRSPDDPPAGHPAPETVRWLRPHELCQVAGVDAPRLFVDSSSSSDVVQGALGDCWLLSALAVVALHRDGLLTQIFAPSACVGLPAGSLTVQFYCEGRWERVTIDDRIPCDSSGYPLYAHCVEPNEMWVPLLEKAYAKLKGSYQALTSGFVDNALVELTGGAPQRFRFQRALGKDSALTESRSPEAPISSDIWGTLSLWMAEVNVHLKWKLALPWL
ncbi:hypothetical protein AB1Y20_015368 [Prymnesium parvum]|uniref:Calpain catalytic domain-containing protein n=1 Tax=Prymnesium parvum TaxID=97485 RepID=A0AB34JWK3_PRYPA